MSIAYTVYDTATGTILRTGTAMSEASARLQGSAPGTSVTLSGSDPVTQVVDVNAIGIDATTLPRQAMNVGGALTRVDKTTISANGTDAVTISNIPNGAKYDIYLPINLGLVQPPDGVVSDGVLKLTATIPGIYSLKLSYQTFLDFQVTFNAN